MAGKGNAEGCASCAKWCLIIFNILFCLLGVGLVAAGVYAYIVLRDYLNIVGNEMLNAPAIVLIVFGCITFLIAAIGCIGACKESPCLLFTFAIIIGILLVAEIAAGIAAFVYRNDLENLINENAPNLMKNYSENVESVFRDSWDLVQSKLECCGYNGRSDWTNPDLSPAQPTVPKSCGDAQEGCKEKLINFVKDNIIIVGAIGVAFGVIELIGIILACCVGCNAKRGTMA